MARVRQGAPVLYVAAFLASILTQSATALYFENYVKWANQAIKGGPTEANCSLAAVDFLDFVYAIIESAAPTVGTAQLTQACISCASAVDASLTYLPASDPGVCPLLPYADVAKLTATALRRFVCFGDGGVDGGSSPAAGSCVVQVVDAIRKVGLLDRIRRLDPTLRFSGHMLEEVCSAMWRAPPAPASCCGRSWSYLMAAITQQSCLPDLSQEYASLPGRCEVLLNRSVPGHCEANWPTDLLPLLTPPNATVDGADPPGSSVVPSWVNGSSCSTNQLGLTQSPGSMCDLWCGVVGEMARIKSGEIPGPENSNNTDSSTNSTPTSRDGGGGRKLQTVTIVIICVFSVLIFALLVGLAIFAWRVHQEKRTVKREQYQFDADLMTFGQSVQEGKAPPPAAAPLPSTPAATGVSMAPTAPTDSMPPTPTPRSVSIPVDTAAVAVAATAAGATTTRTPVYPPGPPLPGPAAEATTGPRASAHSYRSSNPSNTARALVFTGAAASPSASGTAAAAAAATAEAVETASRSSRTSKYESATSLYDKVAVSAPVDLARYLTPAASDGNLQLAAAAAAGGAGARAFMGPASATAVPQPLRSHRLSLSGSETVTSVYQTAYSRDSYSVAGINLDQPSGSYMTVRSTNVGVGVGGNGGGAAAAASVTGGHVFGSEGPSRAQSTGTFAPFASSPP